LRDAQPVDRLITLINFLLSEEALNGNISLSKVRDELLITEDLETLLVKVFEPLL